MVESDQDFFTPGRHNAYQFGYFTDVTTQSEQSIPQNGRLASPPTAPISEAVVLWGR